MFYSCFTPIEGAPQPPARNMALSTNGLTNGLTNGSIAILASVCPSEASKKLLTIHDQLTSGHEARKSWVNGADTRIGRQPLRPRPCTLHSPLIGWRTDVHPPTRFGCACVPANAGTAPSLPLLRGCVSARACERWRRLRLRQLQCLPQSPSTSHAWRSGPPWS